MIKKKRQIKARRANNLKQKKRKETKKRIKYDSRSDAKNERRRVK